ncbi:MAG: helix-turn-helix domain-containing protein [Niabella sp.]|nr:helix-turn-helix domain-containing protein [Niabella sp.]
METLKYKVIKTEKQYDDYCQILHDLDFSNKKKSKAIKDEIDLLTLLIEKYDVEHNIFTELNPVELLKSLMKEHHLKSIDLARKLNISPGLISDITNYKKGISKELIRQLALMFKLSQEAFNRPYPLNLTKVAKDPDKTKHEKNPVGGMRFDENAPFPILNP